jgi:hypothetical protein
VTGRRSRAKGFKTSPSGHSARAIVSAVTYRAGDFIVLEEYLIAYLDGAGLRGDPKGSTLGDTRPPNGRTL